MLPTLTRFKPACFAESRHSRKQVGDVLQNINWKLAGHPTGKNRTDTSSVLLSAQTVFLPQTATPSNAFDQVCRTCYISSHFYGSRKEKEVIMKYGLILICIFSLYFSVPFVNAAQAPDDWKTHREDIRMIQKFLKKQGYHTGKNDGRMGPRTEAAIRAYQTDKQLTPDGGGHGDIL
jgi:hypothetical protein